MNAKKRNKRAVVQNTIQAKQIEGDKMANPGKLANLQSVFFLKTLGEGGMLNLPLRWTKINSEARKRKKLLISLSNAICREQISLTQVSDTTRDSNEFLSPMVQALQKKKKIK